MTSVVDICNDALAMIGHEPFISDINQTGKVAGLCSIFYPKCRDELLRGHPWNFATKRVELAAETEGPAWGFDYRYILPTDCLRVLKIDLSDELTQWKVENGAIVTDVTSPINLLYVARIEDPNQLDAAFARALAARMATDLCMPLANNAQMRQAVMEQAKMLLRDARSADASEGQPDRMWSDIFTEARR